MARYMFSYQCRPGTEVEYVERHKNVWPEVKRALAAAGVQNFTTFMTGNQLTAFIEVDGDFKTVWAKFQGDPEVVKWEEYMSEVLITDVTQGEMQVNGNEVFRFEA